jgi:hypothetical protein
MNRFDTIVNGTLGSAGIGTLASEYLAKSTTSKWTKRK